MMSWQGRGLTALLGALVALAGLQASAADTVRFVAHADRPLITLTREHGMLRGFVDRPLLQVFGDGLVRVERPAYMVDAGRFEYRLDGGELTGLIDALARSGAIMRTGEQLRAERAAAAEARRRASGERVFTADSTTTVITFDFASFARAGEPERALANTVRYADVQDDALRFPDLDGVAALAAAEQALLALTRRAGMTRVAETDQ